MSVPLLRLASLDLLRGFVATGRRMSITLAAQDLCLTQSAISRQIHALEEHLGVKLFVRGHRAIAFTAEGERLFRTADAALQQLQDVFGALAVARERLPVTITASIGVTSLWLLPRLSKLQQLQPQIDVRVAANNKLLDLRAEGIDLAIRYCDERHAPAGSKRLFGETVVPVASPALKVGRLDGAKGIAAHVLLELDDQAGRPWLQWADRLARIGQAAVRPKGTLRFNQYDQVIQAAVAGQGIALGRLALIAPMLEDGRLVAVDGGKAAANDYAYWLIRAADAPRADVRTVADWIEAEAQDSVRVS